MKPEKKTPRRAPKPSASAAIVRPATKPNPPPVELKTLSRRSPKRPVTVPVRPAAPLRPAAATVKPRRVAKKATEAQPQAAPKPALATKSKRVARVPVATMKSKRHIAPRKTRHTKLEIPPLLLTGDTTPSSVSGPGHRYALGPSTPPAHGGKPDETGDLPESYGTAKLWITARDPQWLYAHWDLTGPQQRGYNAESLDGHLVVRVFVNEVVGEPLVTQHVHPESRSWFIHVGRGGTKFIAQLGFIDRRNGWQTIAVSAATVTPPDRLSDDTSADFAKLPVEVPFQQLVETVKTVVGQNVPLMEALAQLREMGHPNLPTADTFAPPAAKPVTKSAKSVKSAPAESAGPAPAPVWTPAQAKALAEIITMDEVRRVWVGSLEITELVRRQLVRDLAGQSAAKLSAGEGTLGLGSPSSPFGALGSLAGPLAGPEQSRGFWFNVNAELVIYGATEPDAKVTIGGRPIRLRPDGTFSYRFALPDGTFALPAIATSAAGDDSRTAELHFSRQTAYRGEVGTHPQDASLKPPTSAAVA